MKLPIVFCVRLAILFSSQKSGLLRRKKYTNQNLVEVLDLPQGEARKVTNNYLSITAKSRLVLYDFTSPHHCKNNSTEKFAYIFDKKLKNMSGYDIIQKNKGE